MLNSQDVSLNVQAAIKNAATNSVFYFVLPVDIEATLASAQPVDVNAFAAAWKGLDEASEVSVVIKDLPTIELEVIKQKLQAKDVCFVVTRDIPGQEGTKAAYFLARNINGVVFYVELKFKAGMNVCKISLKSANKALAEHLKVALAKTLMQ
ncbi:hypothetical protein EON64_15655 [archaeon]|nr:MAG: hypothetical protein EON64_15655 [archaeon]